jgi:Domain of unknown function (DUF3387)
LPRTYARRGNGARKPGLSDEEIAFYDALAENESAREVMGEPKLRVIANELVTSVKGSVTVDWMHRDTARARMRVLVKRILRKYGYPPDLQDAAVQTVLQQAEAPLGGMGECVSNTAIKTIFFLAKIERSFPTLHDAFNRIADRAYIDGSLARNSSPGLIARGPMIAPRHKFGVAIHHEVRIVASEQELPFLFCSPDLLDDFQHDRIIEILLRLVDNQGRPALI